METNTKILVGIDLSKGDRLAVSDLSEPNRIAVEQAILAAGPANAEITFFTAFEISEQALHLCEKGEHNITETITTSASRVLDELIAQAEESSVKANKKFVFGKGWVEIIREVIRGEFGLVVMGTRDQKSTARMLFGSTAMQVIRKCPCPVWVTKPDDIPGVQNILVMDGFDDTGEVALDYAVRAAQIFDSRVNVVHTVEAPVSPKWFGAKISAEEIAAQTEQLKADAEEKINERLAQTDFRTLEQGVMTHVIDGETDAVVVDLIDQQKVDLLVMGTVGRTGIPGMIVGNTAERLLPQVTCSVLAVKPKGFVSPVTA